jgi:spermidine synthase
VLPFAFRPTLVTIGSALIAAVSVYLWVHLPADYIRSRSLLLPEGSELVTVREGITEVVAVADDRDSRRWLFTNGHPMSSTGRLDQRYMRALAHIPLLTMDQPKSVLVIGFGVGNTTHAATLHDSVRRVEVAEVSEHVLEHAGYFASVNQDVLNNPRVAVYVNDGRQHLQMQPESSYDLISLEPPPIAHAGVAALYSKEFYALARSRLEPKGYISQWLPAYQVPAATALSMIRAFLEVFPQAVLLSGAQPNLLLLGANDARIEIDPARVASTLANAPAVRQDLERLDLGTAREIVGTFLGSAQTLADATRLSVPVTDDRPVQEYSVRSLLNSGSVGAPVSVVDLRGVATWCRGCFTAGRPVAAVEGLDLYLSLLARAYMVPIEGSTPDMSAPLTRQMITKSRYLETVLGNAARVHNDMGLDLMSDGRVDAAIDHFQEALRLQPNLAAARRNLAAAQHEDEASQ